MGFATCTPLCLSFFCQLVFSHTRVCPHLRMRYFLLAFTSNFTFLEIFPYVFAAFLQSPLCWCFFEEQKPTKSKRKLSQVVWSLVLVRISQIIALFGLIFCADVTQKQTNRIVLVCQIPFLLAMTEDSLVRVPRRVVGVYRATLLKKQPNKSHKTHTHRGWCVTTKKKAIKKSSNRKEKTYEPADGSFVFYPFYFVPHSSFLTFFGNVLYSVITGPVSSAKLALLPQNNSQISRFFICLAIFFVLMMRKSSIATTTRWKTWQSKGPKFLRPFWFCSSMNSFLVLFVFFCMGFATIRRLVQMIHLGLANPFFFGFVAHFCLVFEGKCLGRSPFPSHLASSNKKSGIRSFVAPVWGLWFLPSQPPTTAVHFSFRCCFTLSAEFFSPFEQSTFSLSVPRPIFTLAKDTLCAKEFELYSQTILLPFCFQKKSKSMENLLFCMFLDPFSHKFLLFGPICESSPRKSRRFSNFVLFCQIQGEENRRILIISGFVFFLIPFFPKKEA